MHANHQIPSYLPFIVALETRFGLSLYGDPGGALLKLKQIESVHDYQSQFEALANRLVGLPPHFFLSYFISRFWPDIRYEIQALLPMSLPQTIGLAQLQEDKLKDVSLLMR